MSGSKYRIVMGVAALIVCAGGALFSAPAPDDGLDYLGIQQLIQSRNIRSIDDLLPLLPEPLLRGYTLVYNSRSIQEASPANPRALVYGTTAKTILTFNGTPLQKGYNNLEVMEFDSTAKEFVLHEITFPSVTDQSVHFSESNPEKCLQCHGNPVRPIWDTYPIWPGVYGVQHEILGGTKDDANYRAFAQATKLTKNRYSNLANIGVVRFDPFPAPAQFFPVENVPVGSNYLIKVPNTGESGSQLSILNKLLQWYNYERIFTSLKKGAPNYEEFKFALLAASDRCVTDGTPIEKYFPDAVNIWMRTHGRTYEAITRESSERVQKYLQSKYDRVKSWDSKQKDEYNEPDQWKYDIADELLPLRYVLMAQNLDIHDWTSTLEFSDDMGTDQGNVLLFSYFLFKDVAPSFPEFQNYVRLIPDLDYGTGPVGTEELSKSETRSEYCSLLQKKSLAALAGWVPPLELPKQPSGSVSHLLQRCITCHTGSQPIGPAIPYDDYRALRPVLLSGSPPLLQKIEARLRARDSSRMPLGPTLSNDEILTLENYFRTLAADAK